MAVSHPGQSSLVHSLATLLRNDGDLVLEGSSTLTLQATSLHQLIRLFEQYLLSRSQQHGFLALPSHPADTESLLQLQFLFDILQKTISLKLINPPEVRLQSVVKIFPFKSLKCLELKRIPPHCLEGLRGIYSQLEVFICSKSLSSLEELLSLCGGDLSSALPWLELHTLNFSYNSIVALDQSLSLLNILKSLDLSHNKIQDCAEFLKPLSELEHLNLGYNFLQRAPMLSLSAKAKLVTLILRNNELETINGVEQLSSLQHLDLAYNLLLEHSQLAPLSLLHSLNTLNLEGNPLFFQKTHRTCTVRHLSPKAASLRSKVKVRRASISEPSDTDYEPRPSSTSSIVLAHQHEIERMSSFRDRLGEDWLRYQHHLDGGSTSSFTTTFCTNQPTPHYQTLQNGLSTTVPCASTSPEKQPSPLSAPEVLPPPLLASEPKTETSDMDGDLETESTLQWPSQSPRLTESTLDDNMVDDQIACQGTVSSPGQTQLSDWLQKRDSHPILELSYLEVGLGSQSIHMEFGDGGVAYTLLVRDSSRCKRFFGLLTDSMLKSISTTRLNPQHHLWYAPLSLCTPTLCRKAIGCSEKMTALTLFEHLEALDINKLTATYCSYCHILLSEDIWMPLTVLATRETLYLLREDHQWRKSLHSQTVNENKEQSSGSGSVAVLETLPISCVSSVHLWPSDQCRIDIKLYDETVKQEKTWCVRSESAELLQGLLAWVTAQWEAMFGVKLHTSLQDKVA
uniref:Serine/threonine-protein kinase 11-interacting protein n=1 Tax=Anabas testudineus TaxID=64144 RepID=A0A7N6AP79_ANATE